MSERTASEKLSSKLTEAAPAKTVNSTAKHADIINTALRFIEVTSPIAAGADIHVVSALMRFDMIRHIYDIISIKCHQNTNKDLYICNKFAEICGLKKLLNIAIQFEKQNAFKIGSRERVSCGRANGTPAGVIRSVYTASHGV